MMLPTGTCSTRQRVITTGTSPANRAYSPSTSDTAAKLHQIPRSFSDDRARLDILPGCHHLRPSLLQRLVSRRPERAPLDDIPKTTIIG
jgi:hypothetical protein